MTEVDERQALLDMANDGRTAELQSTLLQMLAGEGMDPAARALLAQTLTSRAERSGDDDEDNEDVDLEQRLDRSERRRRAIRTLRRRFAAMQDELEELRDRNEQFAAAVGACYRCWGRDPGCEVCDGRGRPGSGPLDRRLHDELVAPALRPAPSPSPLAPDSIVGPRGEERGRSK
jgi:hypothetical protein